MELDIRAELDDLAATLQKLPPGHVLQGDELVSALTLLRAAAAGFDQHPAIIDGRDDAAPPQHASDVLVAVELMAGLLRDGDRQY